MKKSSSKTNKWVWFFVLFSFVLQIFVSLFETYGDTKFYFIPWSQSVERLGFLGFYDRPFGSGRELANYPPVAIYIETFFHILSLKFVKPIIGFFWYLNIHFSVFPSRFFSFINRDNVLMYSFMKLPNILANIFLALGVYFIAKSLIKNKASRLPLILLISVLFNPALIFISALWGQIDTVPLAFITWSFYYLLKKSNKTSVLLFSVALLTKQTVTLITPFYALFYLRGLTKKKLFEAMFIVYLTFIALFFPFEKSFLDKVFPFVNYLKIALAFGGEMLSLHAYNLWQVVGGYSIKDSQIVFLGLSAKTLSQLIVLGGLTLLIINIFNKKNNFINMIVGCSLFSLITFIFLTRMHERHLVVAIPFLLMASLFSFRFYWLFIFESLYLLINMYAAWPIPRIESLATLTNNGVFIDVIVFMQIFLLGYFLFFWIKKLVEMAGVEPASEKTLI